MKSIRSAIHLMNRNNFRESILCHERFYCNGKSDNTTNAGINKNLSNLEHQNDTNVETKNSERLSYEPSAIDKDLAAGITITSYNTVVKAKCY